MDTNLDGKSLKKWTSKFQIAVDRYLEDCLFTYVGFPRHTPIRPSAMHVRVLHSEWRGCFKGPLAYHEKILWLCKTAHLEWYWMLMSWNLDWKDLWNSGSSPCINGSRGSVPSLHTHDGFAFSLHFPIAHGSTRVVISTNHSTVKPTNHRMWGINSQNFSLCNVTPVLTWNGSYSAACLPSIQPSCGEWNVKSVYE